MPPISPNPRDLVDLAQDYATNPSILKKSLRSKAFSSMRRGYNAPGSAAASIAAKAGGVMISKIPVPIVSDILVLAWDKAAGVLRSKSHESKLGKPDVSQSDKIKFSLKELGGTVGDWDNYRWKITHAVEQVNKQTDEAKKMESAPCDQWVKLLAKRLYLKKRIGKLRASVVSVQALCNATLEWLDKVETDVQSNEMSTAALYNQDIMQLKKMAHEGCTDEFCMHSNKKWTSKRAVPTSDAAAFLIKVAGTASDVVAGGAVDMGTDQIP